jgi:hypothetical protein
MYQHGFIRRETSEVIYSKLKDIYSKKIGAYLRIQFKIYVVACRYWKIVAVKCRS